MEVKLLEISVCVAFPAYPEGNTNVRSFFKKCGTDFDEVNAILKREQLSEEDKIKLRAVVDNLEAMIRSAGTDQQPNDTDNATEQEEAEKKAKAEAEAREKEEQNRRARFVFYTQNQEK